MEGARFALVALALALVGCHGSGSTPFPTYAVAPTPYVPNPAGDDAFDAYVLAAGEAETAVAGMKANPLHRTFFAPQQRENLIKALAPALRRIATANGTCEFHYVPARPGSSLPGRAAWRLLGRAFRWRVDDALAVGSYDAAIDQAALAFRFAADLCGGGPADRTLGVEIANETREALLPALPRLSVASLRRLSGAVKAGLVRRPPLTQTFDRADEDMALALQSLQDAYQKEDFAPLEAAMGREFRDLASPLKDMREKDGPKRAAFFDALNDERQRLSKAWHAAAALPRAERGGLLKIKLKGDKTQKAFARHFFLIGSPLLDIEDRSVARLRLLIMEAELRRFVALQGRAPANLTAVKPPWATDPYNGRTFGYQPDGAEFRVYSVGANLKDDLGDTDAAGLDPDIRTVIP